MAFEQHWKRKTAPRPSWNRGATINGKPAWQVAEERRKATIASARGDTNARAALGESHD